LTNVARSLRPTAQLPGEGAIGGRLPPFDTSCRGVDTFEELILSIEIELDLRKIRLVALEIALHGGYRLAHHGSRHPRFRTWRPTPQPALGVLRTLGRKQQACDACVAPGNAAEAACGLEDKKVQVAHGMAALVSLPMS